MKVKVEYTIRKSMEIKIPKALSKVYHSQNPFDIDNAYYNICEFIDTCVKEKEGKDNVDCIIDWDETEE